MDLKKHILRWHHWRNLALFMLMALFVLPACGKKGPPEPPFGARDFQWTWTKAEFESSCLSISGGLEGNLDKLYEVVLEMQPTDSAEYCIGCPFLPVIRKSFSPREAMLSIEQTPGQTSGQASQQGANADASPGGPTTKSETGTINILYCPDIPSGAYQWRLVGVNVYQRMPNALTPVQYITPPLALP